MAEERIYATAVRVCQRWGEMVFELDQPDIVRSIWDEICRATHIVVDLTGLNANVLLELGIAHTLGRNVILISQDPQPEKYFRAIANSASTCTASAVMRRSTNFPGR